MFKRPDAGGAVSAEDAANVKAKMAAFCALYDDANPDGVPDVLSGDFYEVLMCTGRQSGCVSVGCVWLQHMPVLPQCEVASIQFHAIHCIISVQWRLVSGKTKSGRQAVVDNLKMHGQVQSGAGLVAQSKRSFAL